MNCQTIRINGSTSRPHIHFNDKFIRDDSCNKGKAIRPPVERATLPSRDGFRTPDEKEANWDCFRSGLCPVCWKKHSNFQPSTKTKPFSLEHQRPSFKEVQEKFFMFAESFMKRFVFCIVVSLWFLLSPNNEKQFFSFVVTITITTRDGR